jgi:hypothetical protein
MFVLGFFVGVACGIVGALALAIIATKREGWL